MRYINYFYYQLKRSAIAFLHMIGGIILLLLLTIFVAWGISQWFSNAQIFQKVTIGIVIPEDADTTKFVTKVISGMDSVRSICTFTYLSEEEAQEKLLENEIQAAIELSADFYEDVDTGVNTPVTVFFSNENSLNLDIFKELLSDGVSYVQITESAVYAATDHSKIYELKMKKSKMQSFLSELYIVNIYQRGNTFQNCILTETGEVDFRQYYFVIGILLFLLIGGTHFGFFYQKQDMDVAKKLKVLGVGAGYTSAVRVLIMAIYVFLIMLVTYFIGCKVSDYLDSSFLMSDNLTVIGLVPLSFSIASFFHLVFSFAKKEDTGMLLLLGINAIMIICSGGILPMVYFPTIVQKIGEYLPLSFWMDYLQRVLYGKNFGMEMIWVLLIGLVCYGIGTLKICKNT